MTKEMLLSYMLTNGWEWKKSDLGDHAALVKGSFTWFISLNYDIWELINAISQEGYFKGKGDAT